MYELLNKSNTLSPDAILTSIHPQYWEFLSTNNLQMNISLSRSSADFLCRTSYFEWLFLSKRVFYSCIHVQYLGTNIVCFVLGGYIPCGIWNCWTSPEFLCVNLFHMRRCMHSTDPTASNVRRCCFHHYMPQSPMMSRCTLSCINYH